MSGIVGGAGSKSGIIGTTELEYEQGTWTPGLSGFTSGPTNGTHARQANYVRIGNFVHFWLDLNDEGNDVMAWTTALTITGLPTFGGSLISGGQFHSVLTANSYPDRSMLTGYYQGNTSINIFINTARSSQRHLWVRGNYALN